MILNKVSDREEWRVTNKVPKINQSWADGIVSKAGNVYHCTCEQFRKYHDIIAGGCTHIKQVKEALIKAEEKAIMKKSKMEKGG